MRKRFDAIILGTGQAGPFLAARLTQAGQHVALVEREHLGGTCVNDGCMPTKTMVASARVAHLARRAAEYGVRTGEIAIDMRTVLARKDAVVRGAREGLAAWLGGMPRLTLVWGTGRFISPQAIAVGDDVLEADRVFVNTGGRPSVPDWPGLDEAGYLTNTTLMQLGRVPEHLVIVGGSYIGLEFAQMYRRFGARVTVLEHADRLISREDEDVSQAVRSLLEPEGIAFYCGVRDMAVSRSCCGVRLTAQVGGEPIALLGSHLLLAVGRRPNTEALNLGAAGLRTDARGFIPVDDHLQTAVPGIWALGDVNGRGAFTHTAYNDHEIVAANLLDGEHRSVADRIPAYALFIDPPLARIGVTESEARALRRPVLKSALPMTRVGRAKERGETGGFMKVLVDAESRLILGAALLGIEADEVVHALLAAMAARTPYPVLQRTVHIHPTVSEFIPTLLAGLEPLDLAMAA